MYRILDLPKQTPMLNQQTDAAWRREIEDTRE